MPPFFSMPDELAQAQRLLGSIPDDTSLPYAQFRRCNGLAHCAAKLGDAVAGAALERARDRWSVSVTASMVEPAGMPAATSKATRPKPSRPAPRGTCRTPPRCERRPKRPAAAPDSRKGARPDPVRRPAPERLAGLGHRSARVLLAAFSRQHSRERECDIASQN